jgi:hypothetical protein
MDSSTLGLTASNNDDIWYVVKSQEEQRKLRSSNVFMRNRAYWKELVHYQAEGREDAELLIKCMQSKKSMLIQYAKLLNKPPSASKVDPHTTMDSAIPDIKKGDTPELISRKSAGYLAMQAFLNLDESLSKVVHEVAQSIESVLIPTFTNKLSTYDQEVKRLSEHAKLLFLAWILLDGRVHACYEQLQQVFFPTDPIHSSKHHSSNNSSNTTRDKWLLYMKYTVAVQKFNLLMSQSYDRFRKLFQLAKEMETRRRADVTRCAGESHLARWFTH